MAEAFILKSEVISMTEKLTVLSLALLLAGCSSGAAALNETVSPVQISSPAAAKDPANDVIPPEGTYVSSSESFSDPYRPSLTFSEDGTFVMKENLYSGMGEYRGTYQYDGTYYECTVSEVTFSGFAGDDVKAFSLMRFDADNIVLLDNLCGSMQKDVFTKTAQTAETGSYRPAQELGAVTDVRTYISDSDWFSSPYCPTLQLNPDGTFTLTENLFSGMGHYTGTYDIEDINLTLNVEQIDFSGFAGDDIKTIRFEVLSQDVIQLMDDLCGSQAFDYWYLDIPQ